MKLGICIPYRNRKKHLNSIIKNLGNYLSLKKIQYKFYIANQIDKKLFNRGALKNIAAKHAFEDGCDYIAWHDVDMIPADNFVDYSPPKKYPIHIATNLSKFNNGMRYEQYFGGVILFTKEQVEKVNGYSNEYWDWGQEDDDLFWRCYFKKMVNIKKIITYKKIKVAEFNGKDSYALIHTDRELNNVLNNSHTISILFKATHNTEKYAKYLIGDPNKKFIEYPLLRKDSENDWGISFNNSNAVSFMCKDIKNYFYYNWAKRNSELWTWITISYDKENNSLFLFLNDEMIYMENDVKLESGFTLKSNLKYFRNSQKLLIGADFVNNIFFKGEIASFRIHDKFYTDLEKKEPAKYIWGNGSKNFGNLSVISKNLSFREEKVDVIKSILPYRRYGAFKCLPHKDEGFLNGEWIKKNTTSKNEKKLENKILEKMISSKNDGFNSLNYTIDSIHQINDKAEMINVRLNFDNYE